MKFLNFRGLFREKKSFFFFAHLPITETFSELKWGGGSPALLLGPKEGGVGHVT